MTIPIWQRKCDLVYLAFFIIHIPIMLCKLADGSLQISNCAHVPWVQIYSCANTMIRRRSYASVPRSTETSLHDYLKRMVHNNLPRPILLIASVSSILYPPRYLPSAKLMLNSAWFKTYIYLELIYHIPLSIYAIPALLRNDPKLPLHLLIFALEAGFTTMTCIADYMSWEGYSFDEKLELGKLYVPYFALGMSLCFSVDIQAAILTVSQLFSWESICLAGLVRILRRAREEELAKRVSSDEEMPHGNSC